MYLEKIEDFFGELEKINKNNFCDFFMVAKCPPFETLLIQKLVRNVNGVDTSFFGVRDFKLLKDSQGKGIFTRMLEILERNKVPVLIDDIINPKLEIWLSKRGYEPLITQKYNQKINSRFKKEYKNV